MSEIHPTAPDERLSMWLRSVGVAAIAAAALGSVFVATPATPEPPATGTTCTSDIGGNWTFRNCDEPSQVSAP